MNWRKNGCDWQQNRGLPGCSIIMPTLTDEFDKDGHQVANFVVAAEWFRKAADQGYDKAQYELAEMYHNGELGDDQRANCIPWFLKAAAQGDAQAQAEVGELPKYYPNSELLK